MSEEKPKRRMDWLRYSQYMMGPRYSNDDMGPDEWCERYGDIVEPPDTNKDKEAP